MDDFPEDPLVPTDEVKARLDKSRRKIAAGNHSGMAGG
jgi:hypothetical protein